MSVNVYGERIYIGISDIFQSISLVTMAIEIGIMVLWIYYIYELKTAFMY